MRARAVVIGRQRERRHRRAEVGAADADVDDVGDRLAGGAAGLAGAHRVGECRHGVQHRVDLRHDVVAVDREALAVGRPQRDVQHGAVLGDVDLLAGEHGVAPAFDVGRLGERVRAAPWSRRSPRISTSRAGSRRPRATTRRSGRGRRRTPRASTFGGRGRAVSAQFSQSLVKDRAVQFAVSSGRGCDSIRRSGEP